MASRRKLKKKIKSETNLLIEDAFIEAINGDQKEEKKMDGIIDSIIDDRQEMLNKVSAYPNNANRADIKGHFATLKADIQKKASDYSKKIGAVK